MRGYADSSSTEEDLRGIGEASQSGRAPKGEPAPCQKVSRRMTSSFDSDLSFPNGWLVARPTEIKSSWRLALFEPLSWRRNCSCSGDREKEA